MRWQPCRPGPHTLVAVVGLRGSIVLAADDPAALARFYGALLEVEPPRWEPFGAEAWLLDPEGNRVLLLVLP